MRELPNEKAGKECARDRAEAEAGDLEASDPVAAGNHQEEGELGIADQEMFKPTQHDGLSIHRPAASPLPHFLGRLLACCFPRRAVAPGLVGFEHLAVAPRHSSYAASDLLVCFVGQV